MTRNPVFMAGSQRGFAKREIKTPVPIDRKLYKNALEATTDMKDGDTVMAGGFGLCGIPENLIKATVKHNVKDLLIISNECGTNDYGLGLLLRNGQIKTIYASYIGVNTLFEQGYLNGELEVHLIP